MFAEAKRVYGKIDIVIANSGIGSWSLLANTTNEALDKLIATNLNGTFYTLRAAANNISDNGRIIVIGSTLRSGLAPGNIPYHHSLYSSLILTAIY